jgi:hypothetical protein
MDGIFKKTALFFLFLAVISCKKDEKPILNNTHELLVLEGKNLIRQNINVLIDSVIQFDVRLLNEKNDPPKITIGLIDHIPQREISSNAGRTDWNNFVSFKLENKDIKNFKSLYKLNLVKSKNNSTDIVFVTFSELRIEGDNAYVAVKKARGIGMINNTYYFKKENGIWVFTKKDTSNMG